MSADPGRSKKKAKAMKTAWIWICLATLAWLAMAEKQCWDSEVALHDPLTLLSDPEPLVGKHSGGGFLPVPVWKFLKVSDAVDMSDLGRPQFRCSNRSLYLRFLQDRHSDLRLHDGRSLLLLLDRCHGSAWTFGPWLLLELPYTSCPMALKISNGTWFRQMKVSYFDYLQQANMMAAINCEHPASSQCVATPAVSCRSTKILVKLPLGGRLHRVKTLGKDVVLKRILTMTSGSVFVQISTQRDTDSILEMTYLDSAGEMSTVLAACRVKQSKRDRHPRALWDSNVAANHPYSTELSQPTDARDETEIMETNESLCNEHIAVTVETTLTQVAIPDGPSCDGAEEQDDLPCCETSDDDLPCCDPLVDDLPCCTSLEENFPCSEHSHKHPPSSQPPSRFPHGPLQGFSSSQYSSHSELISISTQSTLNGSQSISGGSLTVPHGSFSEGSSKSTSTSDQQAHSRVHSVWHEGQLVEIPSKDKESHLVSQTSVFGSQTVQQTFSKSLDELLSRPGSQLIWGQPTSSGNNQPTLGGSQQIGQTLGGQHTSINGSHPSKGGGSSGHEGRPSKGGERSGHEGRPSKGGEGSGPEDGAAKGGGRSGHEGRPSKGGGSSGHEGRPSKGGGSSGHEGRPSKGGGRSGHEGRPSKGGGRSGHEGRPSKGGGSSGHEGRPSKGGGSSGHEGRPSKGGELSGHESSGHKVASLTKLLGNQQISSHGGHPSKGVGSYSSVIQATLFDQQRGHAPSESLHGFFSSGGSQLTDDDQQIRQTSLGGHPTSVHSGKEVHSKGREGDLEGHASKGGESRPSSRHEGGSYRGHPSSGRDVGKDNAGRHS